MNAIKVIKAGLKHETEAILIKISSEVKQTNEALSFFPLPGKFLQFLSILNDNKLNYSFTSKME